MLTSHLVSKRQDTFISVHSRRAVVKEKGVTEKCGARFPVAVPEKTFWKPLGFCLLKSTEEEQPLPFDGTI